MRNLFTSALFICLLQAILGGQIKNLTSYLVVLKDKEQSMIKDTLMMGEIKNIQIYNQSGLLLSTRVDVTQNDDQAQAICNVIPHSIKIFDLHTNNIKQIFSEAEHVQKNSNYKKIEITGMVHIQDGIIITTSNHYVYGYFFQKTGFQTFYEPKKVFKSSYEKSLNDSISSLKNGQHFNPLMVFNPTSSVTYLVGVNEIVYFKVWLDANFIGELRRQELNISNIVKAVSSQLYLILATSKVIYIFNIDKADGTLTPFKNIVEEQFYNGGKKNLDIQDLTIGGRFGQYLYVLDKSNGVSNFLIERNQVSYNQFLGLIQVRGGYRMDQYMDESLLILVDNKGAAVTHSVIDFSIDIYKGQWFKVNEYKFRGKAFGIDVSSTIAVIRGIDSHRVIFHSKYSGFIKDKQEDIVFFAPKLIALDFFEPNYGKTSELLWHFNQSHNVIFGVNSDQLRYYPWEETKPFIRCYTNNTNHQDKVFDFTFHTNMTQCSQKQQLGDQGKDLVVCEEVQKVQLNVVGVLIGGEWNKYQFYGVITAMILIIAALVALFVWKYKSFKNDMKAKDKEISGLIRRGQETLKTQETPIEHLNTLEEN